MCDDLMPKQIEIDPGLIAATLGQPQQITIKSPRLIEIAYGKGEMKGAEVHAGIGRCICWKEVACFRDYGVFC